MGGGGEFLNGEKQIHVEVGGWELSGWGKGGGSVIIIPWHVSCYCGHSPLLHHNGQTLDASLALVIKTGGYSYALRPLLALFRSDVRHFPPLELAP